jgi:hypothetical protein
VLEERRERPHEALLRGGILIEGVERCFSAETSQALSPARCLSPSSSSSCSHHPSTPAAGTFFATLQLCPTAALLPLHRCSGATAAASVRRHTRCHTHAQTQTSCASCHLRHFIRKRAGIVREGGAIDNGVGSKPYVMRERQERRYIDAALRRGSDAIRWLWLHVTHHTCNTAYVKPG